MPAMARDTFHASASDEPEFEIDSFELLWEQHKSKVILAAAIILVALVGVFGWMIFSSARSSGAAKAFANAKTADDYRAVIANYGSYPEAGDASLLLAESLRAAKKYDEANVVLNDFAKRQPKHPLAPLAKLAAAGNLALAGKTAEAEAQLESISQTDSTSFVAPSALMAEAELKLGQGQRDAAVRIYTELSKRFPTSIAAQASAGMLQAVQSASGSPTPAPAK